MFVRLSALCYVCVCQWLADDGQAGLTAEVHVFWDVVMWGWLSSSNVCKVLEIKRSKKSEFPDPADEGNVILQNVKKGLRTKRNHILEDMVLCSATVRQTLQCIFLCTADTRYSGCHSSSAAQQWSAGSWNKRTWLCSITWRISWGITMYWWRNRPWMQYSSPSVISRSSYRNCRTWGITCT